MKDDSGKHRSPAQQVVDTMIAIDVLFNVAQVQVPVQPASPPVEGATQSRDLGRDPDLTQVIKDLADNQERVQKEIRDRGTELGYSLREPDQVEPDPENKRGRNER